MYSTGAAQFGTAYSSPHWGSLHEVMEMQTKVRPRVSAVCVALQVAHRQYMRPGPSMAVSWQDWQIVLSAFASLVLVKK